MADVGEVRYKAKVDDSGVDQDIVQTEKKIEDSAKKVQDKIDDTAKKMSKTVGEKVKETGEKVKDSTKKVDEFADALGKVKDGPIGKLNESISQTKDALSGIDKALDQTPNSVGLLAEKFRLVGKEVSDAKEKVKLLEQAQKAAKEAFKSGQISSDDYHKIKTSALEARSALKELTSQGKMTKLANLKDDVSSLDNLKSAAKSAFKQLASTDTAVAGLKKLGSATKSIGSISVTALKGIGTAFVGLTGVAAAGVTAVAKVGIDYNAQMQTYQTAFKTMLDGSEEAANKLTNSLKTMAADTPLAMTDLADASQVLLAFGSTADQIPDQLKRLGDVSQGNAEKLGTMATAFGRIQSNGKASMEEINMMIDQGFNPLNLIAEKTGETMEEVRDRVSDGGVSFEEISEALETATDKGGQFYNAMENQSKTFTGQMSTLQDNVNALAGALTEDLFGNLAETALPQVNAWVDELLTAAQAEGVSGAADTMGTILTEVLTAVLNAAPSFIDSATSLVSSFLGAISAAGPQITDGAIQTILTLAQGFVSMVPEIMSTSGTLIAGFINGLADNAPQIVSTAGQLIGSLASGFVDNMPQIITAVGNLAASMVQALMDVDWIQVGKNIIQGLIDGIGGMGRALWDAATNIASSAIDGLMKGLDSHSPSKKAEKAGKTVTQGLVKSFDEDETVGKAARSLGNMAARSLSVGVDYNLPDLRETAKSLSASISSTSVGGARIEVPVSIDGREVARATAWYMGEQLAWEER